MAEELTGNEGVPMTQEQAKAYNEFIDYMAKLYNEFGYLLNGDSKEESV